MVEVAAHLTDHVLPPLPLRQWVFSLPKRLRPFLYRDPELAGAVLRWNGGFHLHAAPGTRW